MEEQGLNQAPVTPPILEDKPPKNKLLIPLIISLLILVLVFLVALFYDRFILNMGKIENINSIDCGQCPPFNFPPQDFCQDGTIVPGKKDKCGCQMPPACDRTVYSPTPTPIDDTQPQIEEVSKWKKTYTDSKYKFQVKYPSKIKTLTGNEIKTGEILILYNSVDEDSSGMRFSVMENKGKMEIKDLIAYDYQNNLAKAEKLDQPPPHILENGKYITINGIRAYQGTKFAFIEEDLYTYFLKGDNVIVVQFGNGMPDGSWHSKDREYFLKILSTFKFLQ